MLASGLMEKIGGEEREFKPLFNGRTFEGWVGDTTGYEVVEETIRCRPSSGGDLRTAGQYDDFVLRFEFLLTPGANNGIAVRAPVEGNAAYEGLEIQVIDSWDVQYAALKPWQHHGSAYGLAAAERGWMLPPGQWNREEIRFVGSRLTVTLNGHVSTVATSASVATVVMSRSATFAFCLSISRPPWVIREEARGEFGGVGVGMFCFRRLAVSSR